jgi:Uma2 family endonuclease
MAIIGTEHVTEETYRRLALGNTHLELVHGRLREKPWMSVAHGDVMGLLLAQLLRQVDDDKYRVRTQYARLRISSDTYYVPDIAVIPTDAVLALLQSPRSLDAYPDPIPLVVEIWSPSTGDYDIDENLPGYQQRGELEIWFIHPYQRTLTVWCRQPDGTYAEEVYHGGIVHPVALLGVTIDLDALFAP